MNVVIKAVTGGKWEMTIDGRSHIKRESPRPFLKRIAKYLTASSKGSIIALTVKYGHGENTGIYNTLSGLRKAYFAFIDQNLVKEWR